MHDISLRYSSSTVINACGITVIIVATTTRTAIRELLSSIAAHNKSASTACILAVGAATLSGERAGRVLSGSETAGGCKDCRSGEKENEKCDRGTHIVYLIDLDSDKQITFVL
jgi:hypothetical protein